MAEEKADETVPSEGEPRETSPPDLLAEKDRQIAELTADLKRIQAEFENFKKRMEREWAERSKLATERLVTDLLPVLDSFDKALEEAAKNAGQESHAKGLEQLHRQLVQTLQRAGLREIDAKGRFDPFVHEAVMREEVEDAEDGKILEVFQKGYTLNSKTIRPARVKVAKRKEAGPESPQQDHDHRNLNEEERKAQGG